MAIEESGGIVSAELESSMFEYKPPYNVVCPKCRAARGGRCLEPVRDGSKFIDQPHPERWTEAAKEAAREISHKSAVGSSQP